MTPSPHFASLRAGYRLNATAAQRQQVELSRVGLHWEEIDEDISIAGLLAGNGDLTRSPKPSLDR